VWADGILVNPDGFPGDTSIGFGPLQTGTYMAKAWNGKTYSANAASFVVTEALVTGGLSTLATKTESSAFSGTKTYVDVVGTSAADDLRHADRLDRRAGRRRGA
jgi:hypothetical protein